MRAHLLHELLEASARTAPDAPAVLDGSQVVSYGELDRRSNQLAGLLMATGVGRGDRVGLYLEKSVESLVAVYGVLKAGAAYVPLDPAAPVKRLAYIVGDCGIRLLLTGEEKRGEWAGVAAGTPLETLVVLNASESEPPEALEGVKVLGSAEVDGQDIRRPLVGTISLDLAYILYTSGSTGVPKGVMLTHDNALAFVHWVVDTFAITAADRLSSHAPLHFDLSVLDLYAAAAAGAPVALVPARASLFPTELRRFIEETAVTVWYSVPSILTLLTLRGGLGAGALPSLRTVLFAGEVFPTKHLRALMEAVPHARFANLYGPTETNVCTWYDVGALDPDLQGDIPIGQAITDVGLVVMGEDGRRVSPGEVGELWVRGRTVMQGYWGDPERTARSLVPDPEGSGSRDPLYRTGDLVRLDDDGELRFLGRRDAQIKSRGYRIDLGDIECALNAHPDVVECAVIPVPDEVVGNRIRAYVVLRDGPVQPDLTTWCAERIPRYMIPEVIEPRRELIKTSTGKIDRQALTALTDAG